MSNRSHPQPRVINSDRAPVYGSAMADIKKEGILRSRCHAARRTIQGHAAMNIIWNGQVRWLSGHGWRQKRFVNELFEVAA